jgi:hypothetical protein
MVPGFFPGYMWSASFVKCSEGHQTIGISPKYTADPSESTALEVPDWLVKKRKKNAERMRINRHSSPHGKKKRKRILYLGDFEQKNGEKTKEQQGSHLWNLLVSMKPGMH